MNNQSLWSLFVLLTLLLLSCKSQKLAVPMEYYNPFEAEKEPSMFFIDVELNLPKVEKALNKNIPDTLFNAAVSSADFDVKAYKAGEIKVDISKSAIDFKIPLSLKISKSLGLGRVSADGEIEMDFRSEYSISPDWDISTTTDLLHHNWIKKPVLKAGFIKIPIEGVADIIIGQMQKQLVQTIDEQIDTNLDLKKLISSVWREMKKPIQASEEFNTWVLLRPADINLLPLSKTSSDTLKTQLQILMAPSVVISSDGNKLSYEKELPKFSWADSSNQKLEMNIISFVPFEEAERLAKMNLLGESFGSGKNQVKVEDFNLFGQGNNLVVETELSGAYNGKVFGKGEPKYDPVKDSVILDDLKIDLKTSNILMKGAGLIFKKKIKKIIQTSVEEQINYNISEMKNMIQKQLDAPGLPKGLNLDAKLGNVRILNVYLTPDGIKTLINFDGHARLMVDGLPDIQNPPKE